MVSLRSILLFQVLVPAVSSFAEENVDTLIYKAEKEACRAFPEPQGDRLKPGARRNFQVLDSLEFLAEFTQHIPPKGSHLIRYYGWYLNKPRGMRRKAPPAVGNRLAKVSGIGN
jgi:hypothetical protein